MPIKKYIFKVNHDIDELLDGEKILWGRELSRLTTTEDKIKAQIAENLIKGERLLGPNSMRLYASIETIGATKRAFFQKYTGAHIQKVSLIWQKKINNLIPRSAQMQNV